MTAYAKKTDVANSIAGLAGTAPLILDTLQEIASSINNDANFSTTMVNALASKAPINNPTFTGTVVGVSKAMVNLCNVDNTSDAAKPVSTATLTELNLKAPINNPHLYRHCWWNFKGNG